MLSIENDLWHAEFSTHGGQLLRCFHKSSPHPVVWLGRKASFAPGSAIRGGSPVCWPWFGNSPVAGRAAQGFARSAEWLLECCENDFCRMTLPEENIPSELRDFSFTLAVEFRVKEFFEQKLMMKNRSTAPVTLSMAFHTYFAVSDIAGIRICGVEDTPYSVKGGPEQLPEKKPLTIDGECCRLYFPQNKEIQILDPAWGRKISVEKENSNSTLIWNPGEVRAAQIADFAPGEFQEMVCVEANRAGGDTLILAPQTEFSLIQRFNLSPFLPSD